jgi:hypothetical protein
LNNFLTALTISSIIPKRQTGGKHYAVHLGPTKTPMTEGTPADRVTIESNFYFPQEDMLAEWAAKHNTKWTVTRPAFIIGANEYVFPLKLPHFRRKQCVDFKSPGTPKST